MLRAGLCVYTGLALVVACVMTGGEAHLSAENQLRSRHGLHKKLARTMMRRTAGCKISIAGQVATATDSDTMATATDSDTKEIATDSDSMESASSDDSGWSTSTFVSSIYSTIYVDPSTDTGSSDTYTESTADTWSSDQEQSSSSTQSATANYQALAVQTPSTVTLSQISTSVVWTSASPTSSVSQNLVASSTHQSYSAKNQAMAVQTPPTVTTRQTSTSVVWTTPSQDSVVNQNIAAAVQYTVTLSLTSTSVVWTSAVKGGAFLAVNDGQGTTGTVTTSVTSTSVVWTTASSSSISSVQGLAVASGVTNTEDSQSGPDAIGTIVNNLKGVKASSSTTTSWTPLSELTTTSTSIVPTTSSSSVAGASNPVSSSSGSELGGGRKAGLGWNDGSGPYGTDFTGATGSQVGWYYTWAEQPLNAIAGIEFLPMLHSSGSPTPFNAAIPSFSGWDVKRLLSINEPDIAVQYGGADMTVDDAVTMHKAVFRQDSLKGYEVSTPAVSNSADPSTSGSEDPPKGTDWLAAWVKACAGTCKYDFFPIHYYGLDPAAFQKYVTDFQAKFLVGDDAGKYIVVTEYGCKQYNGSALQFASQDDTTKFHQTMISWFDQQSWIKGWSNEAAMMTMTEGISVNDPLDKAKYLADPNTMMDATGKINAMGSAWVAMT